MGIKYLTRLLKENAPSSIMHEQLYHLSGKIVAIDTSLFMYQYLNKALLVKNLLESVEKFYVLRKMLVLILILEIKAKNFQKNLNHIFGLLVKIMLVLKIFSPSKEAQMLTEQLLLNTVFRIVNYV